MKKVFVFVIMVLFLYNVFLVKGNSSSNLYIVFDKQSLKKDEIVEISLNLDNFKDLNEIKLQIKLNTECFEIYGDKVFELSNNSIFQDVILNDRLDNYLRLRLLKNESLDKGYYSNHKNNICRFRLRALTDISDVSSFFKIDNYENYGISVYLFDVYDNIINYNASYCDKMNIKWEKEEYILDVNSSVPFYKDDIVISNRECSQYEFLLEKPLNTNIVGNSTIHVGVFDKVTSDYIVISKPVIILDRVAATIDYIKKIEINDFQLDSFNVFDFFSYYDNYDDIVDVDIIYYDKNYFEIQDIKEYLKYNSKAFFKIFTKDLSLNESFSDFIEVSIIDNYGPSVSLIKNLTVLDNDINELSLIEFFMINDTYDDDPILHVEFIDCCYEEAIKMLSVGKSVKIKYFGEDKFGNISNEFYDLLIPIDTTPPTIVLNDVLCDDVDFNEEMICCEVYDNFLKECNLEKSFYIEEESLEFNDFLDKIKKGKKGIVEYIAIDSFNNESIVCIQNVKLNDTIKPKIKVKNIIEGQKYIKLEKVDFLIEDNFENVSYYIFIDDKDYNIDLMKDLKIGNHHLKITADDGINVSNLSIDFEIIDDSFFGCGNDFKCYLNNYKTIVIMIATLCLISIIIIVVRIFISKKNRKTLDN